MKHPLTITSRIKKIALGGRNLAAAVGLLLLTSAAYADDPYSMAPPVSSEVSQSEDGATADAGADKVFNWAEVPENQQVPITRAVFDQGGYQLYDDVGETIVVPFTHQNLYVMKFARSTTGSFYFVNEGSVPVLYVPENGYLDNASVAGAHWYPFSEEFQPSHPVFLGIAPSWTSFVSMGWYPGMYCRGGYWGETSFISGGIFLPSIGLFFQIGGRHYDGWDHYHRYYDDHPAPYHIGYYHRDVYRWAGRPNYDRGRSFGGGDHRPDGPRAFGSGRTYGEGRTYSGGHTFGGGDHAAYAHRTFSGGVHSYQSEHSGSGGHVFQGGGSTSSDGSHSYGTRRTYGGNAPSAGTGRTYGGRVFGGHVFGGGQAANDSHSFDSRGSSSGDGRTFHGGYTRSSSDSGHSYSAHSYSGGDRSASHSSRSNDGGDRSASHSDNSNDRSSGGDHSSRGDGGGDHGGGRSR